jgi:membrane-bound lytic murein transglycosylase B
MTRRPRQSLLALVILLTSAMSAARAGTLDLERPEVKAFVADMVNRNHLDREWVASVISKAEFKASIIDAMERPAEHVKPWNEYRSIFLTEKRIREGHDFYIEHQKQLESTSRKTGVPAEIIAAIVGIETSYGRLTGRYRVLDALATLAFDYPARASYFRGELEQFLLLCREAGIDPLVATGSYAGAMGAPQFMPKSYRSYARDGDGDGKIDLWNSWPDIIESVAHYFVASGWRRNDPIVSAASLFDPDVEGLPGSRIDLNETVGSLKAKGVEFTALASADAPAVFLALRDADGPTYRVGYHNFWVITRYNHSAMYVLAATELAAAIALSVNPSIEPGDHPATTRPHKS